MDLIDRITEKVNSMADLPVPLKSGYLGDSESFNIYPIPGSSVSKQYYDGMKDVNINYELAMKSKRPQLLHATLWAVQNGLENITDITSADNSFEFDQIAITNKPYINNLDEQGWYTFIINIQAAVTTNQL